MPDIADLRTRFADLHATHDVFTMPNPWDVGSALILQSLGFPALATTSSGFAWSIGKLDQQVTRDELVAHVAALTAAIDVPLNVDGERLYADTTAGVAETVDLLAAAGASGISIEDYDPAKRAIDDVGLAVDRVAAAAEAAHGHGITLTARAEAHLYGAADLDDTIARLVAYRDAGADCVYAPGLFAIADIERVVEAVGVPVNVLALPGGPSVGELGAAGVRRVSIGGSLAKAALGALYRGARELLDTGTSTYVKEAASSKDLARAFQP